MSDADLFMLPRLQAIERCSDYRCEYLAWLLRLPNGSTVTGAFGGTARAVSLWPGLNAAMDAFGPGAVIDDMPAHHMTAGEAAVAAESFRQAAPVHNPSRAHGTASTAAGEPDRAGAGIRRGRTSL